MSFAAIRDRSVLWAAPAILLVVASVQAYNVRHYELNPWKGGGFGMFSTVDEPGRRIIRCRLVGEDGSETPLRLPKRLQRLAWEVRSIPTPERVSHLAREVATEFNQSVAKSGTFVRARYVRTEVWRVAFDSGSAQLRAIKMREETVER